MRISSWLAVPTLCVAIAAAPTAQAVVSEDNFLARNAGDLVALCTATQADPLYTAAVNFCQGFTVGAFRVLQEEESAKRPPHMFCLPDSLPSRTEAIGNIVQWVNADPTRSALGATDSIAAYLAQRFPCPRGK
jgi:hypothetical protein